MAVTSTKTVRDIVTQACRAANITAWGEDPAADTADHAKDVLNAMLKGWQSTESFDWTISTMSVAATTSAAHSLSPVRPVRIHHVNWRNTAGTDLPMTRMNRAQYEMLPNKSATGTPTQFYWDRQKETSTLYVWPVPSSVTTETFRVTYERELEDIASMNDTLDMPGEWWDATIANLAARLHRHVLGGSPALEQEAREALLLAATGQNTGSVWFVADEYIY